MKLSDLIRNLQECFKQVGDVPVLLSVSQHETLDAHGLTVPEDTYHGDLIGAAAEQDHNTELMFVRISGDNQE